MSSYAYLEVVADRQGPILMTAGPWRPIRLETYTYRIDDIRIDSDLVGPDYKTATLKAKVELAESTASADGFKYKAVLRTSEGSKVKEGTFGLRENLDWKFEKGEVDSWWPIHYGKQPLYQLEITLCDKVRSLTPRKMELMGRMANVPPLLLLK